MNTRTKKSGLGGDFAAIFLFRSRLGRFLHCGSVHFNLDLEVGRDIRVELDGNSVVAAFLDGLLKNDSVLGKVFEFEIGNDAVVDVFGSDGTEGLASRTGIQREADRELINLGGDFLGSGHLAGLTLGALGFEMVDLTEGAGSDLKGLALRVKKVAGEATADFDDVGLCAELGNICGKNDFCECHRINFVNGGEKLSGAARMSRNRRLYF